MKLVSFILAFLFTFSASAQTIDKIIDEYHYAITVEWDQKDQAFFDEAGEKLFKDVQEISRTNGIEKSDIVKIFESRVRDPKELEALKLKAELLSMNGMNADSFVALMKESQKSLYANGSSWNGEAIMSVMGGVLLAAFFGLIIFAGIQSEKNMVCDGTYYWFNDYGNECDPVFSNGNCHEGCWGNWVESQY